METVPRNFENYLRDETTIQSESDPLERSPDTSSISSSISTLVARRFSRFFPFVVDASASAASTISRISTVLKTKRPLIATLFPFFRFFRVSRSSFYSAFSFRRSVTSVNVFSSARVVRLIYRFTGVCKDSVLRIMLFARVFASRRFVSSGGELASSDRSRGSVVVVVVVVVRGGVDISRVDRIVIGLSGDSPIARNDDRIFGDVKAFSRARMYASIHSTLEIRLKSRRERASVSTAKARFKGLKQPTSRGCNICDECGGNTTRSIAFLKQNAINLAVKCDPCPSRIRSRRRSSLQRVSGSNSVVIYS